MNALGFYVILLAVVIAIVVFFVIKVSTLTSHINILQISLNNLVKRVVELEQQLKHLQKDTANILDEKLSKIEKSDNIALEPKKEQCSFFICQV